MSTVLSRSVLMLLSKANGLNLSMLRLRVRLSLIYLLTGSMLVSGRLRLLTLAIGSTRCPFSHVTFVLKMTLLELRWRFVLVWKFVCRILAVVAIQLTVLEAMLFCGKGSRHAAINEIISMVLSLLESQSLRNRRSY